MERSETVSSLTVSSSLSISNSITSTNEDSAVSNVSFDVILAELKTRIGEVIANSRIAERESRLLAAENNIILNDVREQLNYLDDAAEWQNEVMEEVKNWTNIWDSTIGKLLINQQEVTLAENVVLISDLSNSIEYARNFVYLKRNWMRDAMKATQFEKCRHFVEFLTAKNSDSGLHSQRPTDYTIYRGSPPLQSKEELQSCAHEQRKVLMALCEVEAKGRAGLLKLTKYEESLQKTSLMLKQNIHERKDEIDELEQHLVAATYTRMGIATKLVPHRAVYQMDRVRFDRNRSEFQCCCRALHVKEAALLISYATIAFSIVGFIGVLFDQNSPELAFFMAFDIVRHLAGIVCGCLMFCGIQSKDERFALPLIFYFLFITIMIWVNCAVYFYACFQLQTLTFEAFYRQTYIESFLRLVDREALERSSLSSNYALWLFPYFVSQLVFMWIMNVLHRCFTYIKSINELRRRPVYITVPNTLSYP